MLYHYTYESTFASIYRDGYLIPNPLIVSKQPFPKRPADFKHLHPVVQLSSNPQLEPTMSLNIVHQLQMTDESSFFRLEIPENPAFLTLDEYIKRFGYSMKWFRWFLHSAELAGAKPAEWRFSIEKIKIEASMIVQVHLR
jgi:hypothetical protein